LLETAHYHSIGGCAGGRNSASAPDCTEIKTHLRLAGGPRYSLSAYGFLEVRNSTRNGVPTRLNSLRKRPSRKRL
jgi:hypothetical protein